MGLFSKIGEMIRRIKTPKLEVGQENSYEQNLPQNQEYLQEMVTIPTSNSGDYVMVTSVKFDNQFQHRDGTFTNLMVATVYQGKGGEPLMSKNYDKIAFEVQAGERIDDNIINKLVGYYLYEKNMPNNAECMYCGRINGDTYDYGINKKESVEKYVREELSRKISTERQIQRENELSEKEMNHNRNENEAQKFREKLAREQLEKTQIENQKRQDRIKNCYLKLKEKYVGIDGKEYESYDGVDVQNGDFLRIRNLNKIGIDENGINLYTGYIQTTGQENDVEILSRRKIPYGTPVCFASDREVQDIVSSGNMGDIRSLLKLLSNEENFKTNKEYLNYIGAIYQTGLIDKDEKNTSLTIQRKNTRIKTRILSKKNAKTNRRTRI